MIRKNFSIYRWLVLLLLLVSQANYSVFAQNRKVKLGEIFTLYSGESAETEDAKLKILSASVGRTISEDGEAVFVKVRANLNKSERLLTFGRGEQTAVVGNFIIHIIDAESFGKTYCRLKISRKKQHRRTTRR